MKGSIVTRTARAVVEWLVLSSGVTDDSAPLWVAEGAPGEMSRQLLEFNEDIR